MSDHAPEKRQALHWQDVLAQAPQPLKNSASHAKPLMETPHLMAKRPVLSEAVAAAVLVVISADEDPVIVLTKRARHLSKHAGQISFPGGRVDADDKTLAETALREADEEIGLARKHVNIAGYLPDMLTGTGFCVTPVVARTSLTKRQLESQLVANPDEVEALLFVPLSVVLQLRHYDSFTRADAGLEWRSWRVHHDGHVIWGATAAILHSWANALS